MLGMTLVLQLWNRIEQKVLYLIREISSNLDIVYFPIPNIIINGYVKGVFMIVFFFFNRNHSIVGQLFWQFEVTSLRSIVWQIIMNRWTPEQRFQIVEFFHSVELKMFYGAHNLRLQ